MPFLFRTILIAGVAFATCPGCGPASKVDSPDREAASAQNGPTAVEVIEKMVAVYREVETYMDNAEYGQHFVRADDGIQRQGPPTMVSVLFERPDRFRITRHEPKQDGQDQRTLVVSNGEKLQATITALYPQQLELPAPETATIEKVAPDPLLHKVLFPVPVADIFPQLNLLLAPDAKRTWLPAERDSLVMLPSKDFQPRDADPRSCFLVKIPTTAGPQIAWIDQETYLLLRIELPSEEVRKKLYPDTEFSSFAFRFDFYDALAGVTLPDEAFQLSENEQGTEIVSQFHDLPPEEVKAAENKKVKETE